MDKVICLMNLNCTVDLAKLTACLLTNLRSLESLENLLLLAVAGFGNLPNLPFSDEFRKRKATENGVGLKEYTLNFIQWCEISEKDL